MDDLQNEAIVNLNSVGTQFPVVRLFLMFWLQAAVDSLGQKLKIIPPLSSPSFPTEAVHIELSPDLLIPERDKVYFLGGGKVIQEDNLRLIQVGDERQLIYVCAIGFKLAQSWGMPAIDIASQIVAQFSELIAVSENKFFAGERIYDPRKYLSLLAVPPGWIHLQLTDLGMASWLQSLAEGGGGVGNGGDGADKSKLKTLDLFGVQYVHARCCSLLRLADREGIIKLKQLHFQDSRSFWEVVEPDSLPWLDEMGKLRLVHPTERSLIFHLFSAKDALYCPAPRQNPNWEKLTKGISESFEKFYSQCRIWGEVKRENLKLAQARLGLLMATQVLLRLLLEDVLGVVAPGEL